MDKKGDNSMSTASLETLDSSMSTSEADTTDADTSTASAASLASLSFSSTDDFKVRASIVNCPWSSKFTHIDELNWGTYDYYIRAKVKFKSEICTWPRSKSMGRFFYAYLTDQTATIKAVAFDEVCDLFFTAIEVKIADWTGSAWATLFEEAEFFLGINAVEIVKIHDTNYDEYKSFLGKRLFESHTFVLQARMNVYDDENRVNTVIAGFYKNDYKRPCRRLIKGLKRLERLKK